MNFRVRFFLLCFLISYSSVFGQRWKLDRCEVQFGIGTTDIFGQIGGAATKNNLYGLKDINLSNTGPSVYLATRYKMTAQTALKLNLIYGYGDGSDAGSIHAVRDYKYTTSLFEFSLQYEYYFLKEERKFRPGNLYNRRGMINNYSTFSLYGFLGAGGLYFDPKLANDTNKNNNSVEYIKGYDKFTLVIPLGLGGKMVLNKDWALGLEFGRRFTFSSYLEGINTKYSKSKDLYYFGIFQFIYNIETDRRGVPVFLRRKPR